METPLDLNTLPQDFIWDHSKQLVGVGDTSSTTVSGISRIGRKGSSKDERRNKVYECRFCSLKFGKSQALGGHMNRHRQERETETLNQARQLVLSTDTFLPQPQPPHGLGGQPGVNGGYQYYPAAGFNMGTTIYPNTTRLFSGTTTSTTTTMLPQLPPSHHQQHVYSSSLPSCMISYSSESPPNSQLMNDYFVDHYISSNPQISFQNFSYI